MRILHQQPLASSHLRHLHIPITTHLQASPSESHDIKHNKVGMVFLASSQAHASGLCIRKQVDVRAECIYRRDVGGRAFQLKSAYASHLVRAAEQLCEVVQRVGRQLKGVPQAQQHRQHLLQPRVPLHALVPLCTAGSAVTDPHTAPDSAAALQIISHRRRESLHAGSHRANRSCEKGSPDPKPPGRTLQLRELHQTTGSSSVRAGRYQWLTILVLVFLSLLLYNLKVASQGSVLDVRLVGPLRRGRAFSLRVSAASSSLSLATKSESAPVDPDASSSLRSMGPLDTCSTCRVMRTRCSSNSCVTTIGPSA